MPINHATERAIDGFISYQNFMRRHADWYRCYHDDYIDYLDSYYEEMKTFPIERVRRTLFKEGSAENPIVID